VNTADSHTDVDVRRRFIEWLPGLNSSPMAQVKFLKESPGRLRFLSLEEEAKLCGSLGPPYADWVRLAILTGMRQMEQFSLRWEYVDNDRGLLTIPHTKAGGTRYVHLNAEGVALLRSFTSWMDSQWVFPSKNSGTILILAISTRESSCRQ
jgi:integrase